MFKFIKSKIQKASTSIKKFAIGNKLKDLFSKKINEDLFEELEQILYEADLGVDISCEVCEKIKAFLKKNPSSDFTQIIKEIKQELLKDTLEAPNLEMKKPQVIMIIGANGAGKTTSIAKLISFYKNQNKKVLVIAADTYRTAAVDQLETWAKRLNTDIIKSQKGADPASVVFDGLTAAQNKEFDVVLIDTAGRLHTKTNLMQELEKIKRTSSKIIPNSPHETILVLDASIGQNALDQATIFNKFTPISSIFLSKLDGTAKGGIIIAIQKKLNIPIKWIGLGEKEEDIEPFNKEKFIEDLFMVK